MNRPATFRALPQDHDPIRRIIAAVALKAVSDYLYPPKNLSRRARNSAVEFLQTDGFYILQQLNIPAPKIRRLTTQKQGGPQ